MANVLILQDIAEKKSAEEKLRQSWQKLRKAMDGIIQAMALVVETRDPYTAGHQHRVTEENAGKMSLRGSKSRGNPIKLMKLSDYSSKLCLCHLSFYTINCNELQQCSKLNN